MSFQKFLASFALAICLSASSHAATTASNDKIYADMTGTKGLILCFHGHGGSSEGWAKDGPNHDYVTTMRAKYNYSYICPSSLDRTEKKWSPVNSAENPDVKAIDAFLARLKVSTTMPIFLVGHSNGGGFVTRYAMLSSRKDQIKAVQYSNSSGLLPVVASPEYRVPTLFMYAQCDQIVDYNKVMKNSSAMLAKTPVVLSKTIMLDSYYPEGSNCHPFISLPDNAAAFFDLAVNPTPVKNGPLKKAAPVIQKVKNYLRQ